MKVSLSVPGRFHGFHLAREVGKVYPVSLFTTYPKFEAKKYVDNVEIRSIFEVELARRLFPKFMFQGGWNVSPLLQKRFDERVANLLSPESKLFVGWSSFSVASIQEAHNLGMKTILERGSSHILEQSELLCEEYMRFGLRFEETSGLTVERELAEYAETDYISVLSKYSKESFIERGTSESKIIHEPLGVDVSRFHPRQKEDGKFRVVYCGSISVQKGVYYLVRAFSELKLKDAELWLVGSRAPEMTTVLKGLSLDNVSFKGIQKESELDWYYNQANVFVLPSIQDGFGMVFAQAMACGKPVIATENTGAPDIVREGVDGFIVPIRSVSHLKEKILWCYENREKAEEMGRSALERIQNGWTWEDYGKRMRRRYDEICLSSSPSLAS